MKYDKLVADLQNLTNRTDIDHLFIGNILGVDSNKMGARKKQNYNFKPEEIEIIENHLKIDLSKNNECIEIDYIYQCAECGVGSYLIGEPEVGKVQLGTDLIKNYFRCTTADNLKAFPARGDSMIKPDGGGIKDGNLLLIDIGRLDIENSGIFVVAVNNALKCKRLRKKINGDLEIISDNPKYEKEVLTPDSDVDFRVLGRVMYNLNKEVE